MKINISHFAKSKKTVTMALIFKKGCPMMEIEIFLVVSILVLAAFFVIKYNSFLKPLNYDKKENWVAFPSEIDKEVDVFYVYPTIYGEEYPKNMDVKRPDLRAKAHNLLFSQAGVFKPSANMYVPLYQQTSMVELMSGGNIDENKYFKYGLRDIEKAFDYYLKNSDRPFILAGHSQGSEVLLSLIKRKFNDSSLQKRLVAAYLIGYSVTEDDLKKYPWIKAAENRCDNHVVITFNTQAPESERSPVLHHGAKCINPLSWKVDASYADNSLNLGAVFYEPATNKIEREIPGYTGAQIDLKTGALNTAPPEKLKIALPFTEEVYHQYDYSFWYRNLEQNVKDRVENYLKNN